MTVLALPLPQTLAQSIPPQNPNELYQLSFASNRGLTPVNSSDILDSTTGKAQWQNIQQLVAPPSFNTTRPIQRELDDFWRMRVRIEDLQAGLKAEYKFTATGGTSNPFNNANIDESFSSEVTPVSTDTVDGTAIVRGRVRVRFNNISQYRNGSFSGRLSVCVKRLDTNICL